jgi:hypothetical protein
MNEEFQAMQVTLEGIKIGAELSAKAVRTIQNLFLAIGSNLKRLAINRADKKLLNAKGQVDSKKIFKMTKDVAFLKLEDSKLDLFFKECEKYHVPAALMDKYVHQGNGYSYIMYPQNSAPSIAQIREIIKNHEMEECKKKGTEFNETDFDSKNGPVSMSELAKDIGADRSDFIEKNKDKFDSDILESAKTWKNKETELDQKKSELEEGIAFNNFKRKSENASYDLFTFRKEDVLSGADTKHQNIKVSDDFSIELPKNLNRRVNQDGSISVLIKKDKDFAVISNKDKSRKVIKGLDIKSYTSVFGINSEKDTKEKNIDKKINTKSKAI